MARPIQFASRFPRTWKSLSQAQKERILDIIIELPDLMKNPHQHSGFGLRRLQGSAYYEARIDLRWRLIMKMDTREIVLFDVLNHDQVRRLIR
jgi:mRNA-degrading endonuclease RelE of RelBE toxin-antitoxin system